MDKMTGILNKLTARSRDGKITWRDTVGKQKFLAMLGETGVAIDFNSETGVYELQILDKRGRLIESVSAGYGAFAELRLSLPGAEKLPRAEKRVDVSALRDLHEVARRSALNIDATLDELASHLDAIV